MPDYLGKDQRKTKNDDDKEEKPIQGTYFVVQGNIKWKKSVKSVFQTKYIRELFLSFFSSALDEGDIEILKTYVSFTTHYYYRNLSC